MEPPVINTPASIYLESRRRAKTCAAMQNVECMNFCIAELESEVCRQYEQWKRDHRVL